MTTEINDLPPTARTELTSTTMHNFRTSTRQTAQCLALDERLPLNAHQIDAYNHHAFERFPSARHITPGNSCGALSPESVDRNANRRRQGQP
jgi:hypothetical protein